MNFIRKYFHSIVLVLGLILLYRDSFFSRFFQDDKLNLQMAKAGNWLAIVPGNYHFHPVSIQLFYSAGNLLTPDNPFGFHLILFIFMLLTLFLLYHFANIFFKDKNKSFLAVILYAFSLINFASYYWIANSHFAMAPFFALAAVLCYHRKQKIFAFLTPIVFLIGLGSNEMMYIFPLGLILFAVYQKDIKINRLAAVCAADMIAFFLRLKLLHLSSQAAYRFVFDLRIPKTIWWYVLRVLDLPEGIRNGRNGLLYLLLAAILFLMLVSLINQIRHKTIRWKIFIFGGLWFFIFGLTFFLLPNHMSGHYLSTALFGPALIFAEVIKGKKLIITTVILYLLLTYFGLEFLKTTHWIILKNTGPIGSF